MGVSKNIGTPKWMIYNGKPYQNSFFLGTTIFGNIHISIYISHPKEFLFADTAQKNPQLTPSRQCKIQENNLCVLPVKHF